MDGHFGDGAEGVIGIYGIHLSIEDKDYGEGALTSQPASLTMRFTGKNVTK